MSPSFNLVLVFCAIHMDTAKSVTLFPFHSLESITKFSWELDVAVHQGMESGANINESVWYSRNNHIALQLNDLVMQMDDRLSQFRKIWMKSPPALIIYTSSILDKLKKIKEYYENAVKYSNTYNNLTFLENSDTSTIKLADDDIWTELKELFIIIDPLSSTCEEHDFWSVYKEYTKGVELCGGGVSPNYYLYNLYTLLISAEITGIISLRFKYVVINKVYHPRLPISNCPTTDFDAMLLRAQTKRIERLKYYFQTFSQALASARSDFRSCDPSQHIRDETFFEMENLFQDILIDEFSNNYENSCHGTCKTIRLTNHYNCSRIFYCVTIDDPTYCELKSGRKRYQWVEDVNKQLYGMKTTCRGEIVSFSWSYYYLYICEKCWCLCEGSSLEVMEKKPHATHVFSLLPSESNITNNMVVTGIRFIVEDGIVHIQMKEGQLGEQGRIVENSQSWKKNPDMRSEIIRARKGFTSSYQSGKDFIVIEGHSNAINLDDVIVPIGHVVTGIKFGLIEKGQMGPEKHLQIQVQHMPFNFALGNLNISSKPQWMSPSPRYWKFLQTSRTISSENVVDANVPTESFNSYIEFGPSSYSYDFGQTTVPFLDGVKVETLSGPLSGIGLFHKGIKGFGGFLSFRLYSLNMAQYIL